ncbi:MAG: dienelactone hydrolase family protein [Chloroflexota bacterium]|nr:dienelactone hydrolase family protein [Chloroflexota bacterium]
MKSSRYASFIILCMLLLAVVESAQAGPRQSETAKDLEPIKLSSLKPGSHQQGVSLPSGGSLRYTISIPAKLKPENPVPLIVALHYGYSGRLTPHYGRGMLNELVKPAFEELGAVIIAPDVLGGGDWNTRQNEQAVVWLTKSAMKSYPINPKKVLITGFSMGAIGTWYIGVRHQDLFTAAIPIAGKPADEDSKWTIPVYVIHSTKDAVLPIGPTKKYVEKLKVNGANVELKIIDDLTHFETSRYVKPLKEAQSWLGQAWK